MTVSGRSTARYLRGLNLLAREQDGALQYYLFNAHGDVTGRCDGWGNLLKAYRYDAFGVETEPEKLDANPFRYCGEYFDRETETVYLRAREYAPGSGRFLSEDSVHSTTGTLPNEQKVIDPLSLNRYTYCHGNPVLYRDPSGNSITAAAGYILAAVAKFAIPIIIIGLLYIQAVMICKHMGGSLQLPGTSLMPPDYSRNKETFPLPEERQNTAIVEPPLTPKAGPYRESLPTRDDHLSDLTKPSMFPDNTPVIRNGNIWTTEYGGYVITDEAAKHIFQEKHMLQDTLENRRMLLELVGSEDNFVGADRHGKRWYSQIREDGTQAWANTWGNKVQDGGINPKPKTFHPSSGFSSPTRPGWK